MTGRPSSNRGKQPPTKEELVARVNAIRDQARLLGRIAPDAPSDSIGSARVDSMPSDTSPVKKPLPSLPYRADIDG